MFENSGNPASKVQCTIDQYFDISKLSDEVREFIISPRDTGRMWFYDEYDKSEKDCMWEEY